jgi:hypothetical protein
VLVLATGEDRPAEAIRPSVEELRAALRPPAGEQGIFNRAVSVARLANIGLDADDNANTTQRLLLLLESAPLLGAEAHRAGLAALLDAYLAADRKDRRPPRFLLNDVVRYWRTICVDFEGKAREGDERKWALRHAKLRTSRAMLFAGGLVPVLECHHVVADAVPALLLEQFTLPPTDRLAAAFLAYDAADAGARTFGAYDRFLGLLDDRDAGARSNDSRVRRRSRAPSSRPHGGSAARCSRGCSRSSSSASPCGGSSASTACSRRAVQPGDAGGGRGRRARPAARGQLRPPLSPAP